MDSVIYVFPGLLKDVCFVRQLVCLRIGAAVFVAARFRTVGEACRLHCSVCQLSIWSYRIGIREMRKVNTFACVLDGLIHCQLHVEQGHRERLKRKPRYNEDHSDESMCLSRPGFRKRGVARDILHNYRAQIPGAEARHDVKLSKIITG